MKKWLWIIGIFFLIVFSILIGYFLIVNSKTSKEENILYKELANNENSINSSDIIVTNYSGFKISPNTKIVYETYYKKCNHKERKEERRAIMVSSLIHRLTVTAHAAKSGDSRVILNRF